MEFRIGVNLGDVIAEGEQIGDGVNVAARLESLADPGGICISGKVHEEIRNKLALNCEDLGEQRVKNIAEPVRMRPGVFSMAGLALIATIILLVQHVSLKPPGTSASVPSKEKRAVSQLSIPITDELITKLSRLSHLLVIALRLSPTKTSRVRPRTSAGSWA